LLVVLPWLMPRAYGRLFILQRGNSDGFFTASVPVLQVSDYRVYQELATKTRAAQFVNFRFGFILRGPLLKYVDCYRDYGHGSGC
jgi:hypothetical protein